MLKRLPRGKFNLPASPSPPKDYGTPSKPGYKGPRGRVGITTGGTTAPAGQQVQTSPATFTPRDLGAFGAIGGSSAPKGPTVIGGGAPGPAIGIGGQDTTNPMYGSTGAGRIINNLNQYYQQLAQERALAQGGQQGGQGLTPEQLSLIQATGGDIRAAEGALAERKAQEGAGIGALGQGIQNVGQTQRAVGSQQALRNQQIMGGNMMGQQAINIAGQQAAGMPGRVARGAAGQQQGFGKESLATQTGATGRAQQITGRQAAGAAGIRAGQQQRGAQGKADVMGDLFTRVGQSIQEAGTNFNTSIAEAEKYKTDNLAAYKNMTAQAISTNRQAIDANYKQIEDSINSDPQYANNPAGRKMALMQAKMGKVNAMADMGAKISTQYNDARASMTQAYDQMLTGNRQVMSGLMAQVRSQADQITGQINSEITTAMSGQALQADLATEQTLAGSEVQLAGQTTTLAGMGLQMKGQLSNTAMEAISWAEQNGAKLASDWAGQITQLWNDMTNFGLMHDAAAQQTQLAFEQLSMAGLDSFANMIYGQTSSYVPIAPYMAGLIQFFTEQAMQQQTMDLAAQMSGQMV